jgi:uncharacterized membrane protein YfcA
MPDIQLISIVLGLFVGLILALTGAGGSILAIPLLIFGVNLSLNEAAPIALLAIMSAATIASIQGLIKGNVRYKSALLMSGFGLAIAPVGVWLAVRVPIHYLSVCLALIMLYIAWRMWHQAAIQKIFDVTLLNKPVAPCEINPATSKLFWTANCTKRLMFTGAIAGLFSGMLGVGGGFVIVPSLRKVSNFDVQTTIATSLAVIAIVSAGSVAIHLHQGGMNWQVAIPFVLSSMLSMFVFRLVSHRVTEKFSQRSFAVLAVIAAILMLIKAYPMG